jgi:hypothetical protein
MLYAVLEEAERAVIEVEQHAHTVAISNIHALWVFIARKVDHWIPPPKASSIRLAVAVEVTVASCLDEPAARNSRYYRWSSSVSRGRWSGLGSLVDYPWVGLKQYPHQGALEDAASKGQTPACRPTGQQLLHLPVVPALGERECRGRQRPSWGSL